MALTPQDALPPTPPSDTPAIMSNTRTPAYVAPPAATAHKHIWVITGPAGCGKTSVAEYLHQTFSFPYLEGDTFHTPANVEKMAAGHPLTDADRWDWLIQLRQQSLLALSQPLGPSGVIITCSALKRKYRDVLRIAHYHDPTIKVHFIFLHASEALLMDRVRARQNHYMKDYMVRSQFESLETPTEEERDVLSVDAGGTSGEVQRLALGVVEGVLRGDAAGS
ncbi:uncharacterized protein LTR77_006905 [Saxophila tyrrhenica]|uniref:Gluconokinase n=1 Tax=Saxophila tyrrhenica TaxID=1690608 RepID=A0AAV9P6S1_9PEZI|nr:hypothetical protein LTR77_006905 [Saxophila tyrrhenica]